MILSIAFVIAGIGLILMGIFISPGQDTGLPRIVNIIWITNGILLAALGLGIITIISEIRKKIQKV